VIPAVRPEIVLVKLPIELPSVVLLFEIVGVLVPQQIPDSRIGAPPSLRIVPPLLAVYLVMDDAAVVAANVGTVMAGATKLLFPLKKDSCACEMSAENSSNKGRNFFI
jgi:hypothetical protein